jgi:hypothetical protein
MNPFTLEEGKRSLESGKLHNPHVWNRKICPIHLTHIQFLKYVVPLK